MMLGSLSEIAKSSIRPPMLAGPTDRNRKFASAGSFDWLIIGTCGTGAGGCPCENNDGPNPISAINGNATRTKRGIWPPFDAFC
jgi:hypothetical protein